MTQAKTLLPNKATWEHLNVKCWGGREDTVKTITSSKPLSYFRIKSVESEEKLGVWSGLWSLTAVWPRVGGSAACSCRARLLSLRLSLSFYN